MKKRVIKSSFKKGRLSKEEKSNIEDWLSMMDTKDIAQRLNRPLKQVEEYKKEFLAHAPRIQVKRSETEEFRRELHAGPFWSSVKDQFTDLQITYYENSYIEYRRQFKDLTPTEAKQLHQLISFDIFMTECNVDRKGIQQDIDRLERNITKLRVADLSTLSADERGLLMHYEQQLLASRQAISAKVKDHAELFKQHNDLLKSLKSTRDQRMKSVDAEGRFLGVLKALEIESRRKSVGELIGLMDLAVEKEMDRLSAPHLYKDNMIDIPIMNSETIENLNEEQ